MAGAADGIEPTLQFLLPSTIHVLLVVLRLPSASSRAERQRGRGVQEAADADEKAAEEQSEADETVSSFDGEALCTKRRGRPCWAAQHASVLH